MSSETEYKLENVAVTVIESDKIDATFRSSTIGEYNFVISTPITASENEEAFSPMLLG